MGQRSALGARRDRALRSVRSERGQAMVEFALVLPLLALILFGILQFGRALNYWIDETHLAAEGARLAAVGAAPGTCPDGTTPGSLAGYVQCQADTTELRSGGGDLVKDPARVCITFPNGTANRGDPVQVTVTSTLSWLPIISSAESTLTGSATMRLETDDVVGGCS